MTTQPGIFEWVSNHLHVVGWGTIATFFGRLIYLTYKHGGIFLNFRERALAVETSVNKMAGNCMPSVQRATEATSEKLDKHTELLESIDKSLAVLVDRKRD
jgi:hypothetical protein